MSITLQKYRDFAQTITVGGAVATGIVWIIATISHVNTTSWLIPTLNTLIVITAIGGIAMGLLYAFSLVRKK